MHITDQERATIEFFGKLAFPYLDELDLTKHEAELLELAEDGADVSKSADMEYMPSYIGKNNQPEYVAFRYRRNEALLHAARKGMLDVVNLLLEKGWTPEACQTNVGTPLIAAAQSDSLAVLRVIVEHATPSTLEWFATVKDCAGMTALDHAAANGFTAGCTLLVVKTKPEPSAREKAAHWARGNQRHKTLAYLQSVESG